MAIKLNNFVNVELSYTESQVASSTRTTVALINLATDANFDAKVYTKADYDAFSSTQKQATNYVYFKNFFENGGIKLDYIKPTSSTLAATIATLPDDEIVVATVSTQTAGSIGEIFSAATNASVTALTGTSEKLLLGNTTNKSYTLPSTVVDNVCIKYGTNGIEMTIAAYLCQIDVENGTLNDYCFTSETVDSGNIISVNSEYTTLKAQQVNTDITLVNETRNVGGNTCTGKDLTNYYVKIVLAQTLSERLLALLATKIRYDQYGLNQIAAAIVTEMETYKKFGFLSSDKKATQDYYDSTRTYLLLEKNTLLSNGYSFYILPFETLLPEDKANHKLPKIYMFIADSYAIRMIDISGKLF